MFSKAKFNRMEETQKNQKGYLVLTRYVGEKILIGDDIEIIVTEFKGSRVNLGIKAPAGVTVLRAEVRDRIEGVVDANA